MRVYLVGKDGLHRGSGECCTYSSDLVRMIKGDRRRSGWTKLVRQRLKGSIVVNFVMV